MEISAIHLTLDNRGFVASSVHSQILNLSSCRSSDGLDFWIRQVG